MSLYFAASGLAYQKGIDDFEVIMPKSRFQSLYLGILQTKGFEWAEKNFAQWIIIVAHRSQNMSHKQSSVEQMNHNCPYLLIVEHSQFHPGGTCLRGEAMTPADRCLLKPKKDNFGRVYSVARYVASGGSPIDCAHPCSGNCPLKRSEVPA